MKKGKVKRSRYRENNGCSRNTTARRNKLNERLAHSVRVRITQMIKNKSLNTVDILGCTWEELKVYLESKFQEGMSWENYGRDGWHIDHIKPLSKFNLNNPDELKKACHYSNLQPLWAKDNLRKSNKE